MTIGERIRQRRIELNMTQDELAKRTGYKSRSSINKLENARALPSRKIEKMAYALECTPSFLMGWTDNPGEIRISVETEFQKRLEIERIKAYSDRLYAAYRDASPDTQKAVRVILNLEGFTDADR